MSRSENLLDAARQMRHNPTEAENRLWAELRGRKFSGYKFRRQHIIDRFIVDFCCPQKRLVVEVDGDIHLQSREYDQARTEYLNDLGYFVLRVSNQDVMERIEIVKLQIQKHLENIPA
ncbi:MAG: endonuclease domain-containing protein [Anaerolineales bacterium]|nr:endonuclease domain-containing protein [Anaerolineales bacterium]